MTDLDSEELEAKISIALRHLVSEGLGMDVTMVEEMPIEQQVKIFGDALTVAGLNVLNYVKAPSERGESNA